jgi:hypothetical protein
MASIREVTALVLLYGACRDADARSRAIALVPDLADLVADAPPAEMVAGFRMVAYRAPDDDPIKDLRCDPSFALSRRVEVGRRLVVCRRSELPVHERVFASEFPYADVVIVSEPV